MRVIVYENYDQRDLVEYDGTPPGKGQVVLVEHRRTDRPNTWRRYVVVDVRWRSRIFDSGSSLSRQMVCEVLVEGEG